MIWSIAWRNVWRNRLRSSVVVVAVTLGLLAGVFTTAFMRGLSEKRIQDAIRTEISHIQIHMPGFSDNTDFSMFIPAASGLADTLNGIDVIAAATRRIVINSMIASAETGTGVMITGVDPGQEMRVTNIHEKITEGEYFRDYRSNPPVVIGEKLAHKLHTGTDRKVVITVTDIHGNTVQGAFKVAGIYRTDNAGFDERNVFVRFADLAGMTGFHPSGAHEIAVRLHETQETDRAVGMLRELRPDLEVLPWQETSPELGYLTSAMDQYMYIFVMIILLALCFGIINTMLMAVLERVKELGMLMAIGMNRIKIFFMIMLESVFLSLTGGILGIVAGYLISKYYQYHDIHLPVQWVEGFREIGYSATVNTITDLPMVFIIALMVIITGVVSSLFPAYKALRLNPADAIRTDN
ncbi:MAG: ABC transporter permease [Bacteroidales bacterium]|nr:ABC transporter permease [Bacteroidales bacterium]